MFRAIRALLRRRQAERELEKEIAFHIEQETQTNIALGMSAEEANRRARVAFGSIENTKEVHRDGRGARWIEDLASDLRYAFRQIRHSPMFTLVAVTVLGVGIGVNSALVAFVDAIIKPRIGGIERAQDLVRIDVLGNSFRNDPRDGVLGRLIQFKDEQTVFSSIALLTARQVLAGTGSIQEVRTAGFVTGDYFTTVRPRILLGRPLPVADDRAPIADASALVSHEHWRAGFGGDSSIIGMRVNINGVPTSIVGVLPDDFSPRGADTPSNSYDYWLPIGSRSLYFETDSAFWAQQFNRVVVGRMAAGATLIEAANAVRRFVPACQDPRSGHELCRDDRVARSFVALTAESARAIRIVGLVLSILTGLILAIACANLSILLLGRAVARRREIAVRLSLGAGRRRVIRQLLTESMLLSAIGGAIGLALLMAFRPLSRVLLTEFHTDLTPSWTTILISMGIAMVTGIGFGLVPALHSTRASVATALKDSVAGIDRGRARLQRWFVVGEVTVSIALVSIMGLFVQAVRKTMSVHPGYDVSPSVLVAELPLYMAKYQPAAISPMLDEIQRRVAVLPGVQAISLSNIVPSKISMVGFAELDRNLIAEVGLIDESYFDATGVQVVSGRGIGDEDTQSSPMSVVITPSLAATMWPGEQPIGKVLSFATTPGERRLWPRADSAFLGLSATVVGVADSAGRSNVNMGQHRVYMARRQIAMSRSMIYLTVRANQAPATVAARTIEAIHSIDPALPISAFTSTAQRPDREAVQAAWGAVIAGGLALALACVGLFAIVAFAVAHRSREIGIRVALGATHQQVVGRFFGEGMRLATIGFVIGVPIAIAFMRIAQSQVQGVPTVQAMPIAVVVGILLTVTALASWIPARRATRVDPIESLRAE